MNQTIAWIKTNELPGGGISAWPGGPAYQEVTGYLIPTLFDRGERELAVRCADWLVSTQHHSGGFYALDGSSLHTFDTAAVIQGLERAYHETGNVRYLEAYHNAHLFLGEMERQDGLYWTGPAKSETRQYLLRVNGITGINPGRFSINGSDRSHYIAYALEGYLRLGYEREVRNILTHRMPIRPDGLAYMRLDNWQGDGSDVIATAQLAILGKEVGLDVTAQVEAVRRHVHPNGGVPQSIENQMEMSWGAKFYLDMEVLCK